MQNSFVTDAINLKSYNLSESDRIMVMYSKEKGLIRGVAKGVKKTKSKLIWQKKLEYRTVIFTLSLKAIFPVKKLLLKYQKNMTYQKNIFLMTRQYLSISANQKLLRKRRLKQDYD